MIRSHLPPILSYTQHNVLIHSFCPLALDYFFPAFRKT